MSTHKVAVAKRGVALGLTLTLLASPISGLIPAAQAAEKAPAAAPIATGGVEPVSIRSILIFPISNKAGTSAEGISGKLDDAIRMKLETVNKFKITRFSRLLPSVQRGLDDKDLTDDDLKTPFADDDTDGPRAAKIATRLDTDSYFLGNLESYSVDGANKKVSLQVTGNLYNTRTGYAVKNIGLSVNAGPLQPTDQLDKVIANALDDAASQVASSINGLPVTPVMKAEVVRSSQRGQSGGAKPVLLALLLGAAVYFAFHHDSSSGGSSSSGGTGTGGGPGTGGDGPPAPPL
jgi:hypothetical protein